MKIIIETIPHESQRYRTVGDWLVEKDGTRRIFVSDMGNEDYAFLVALHELIEQKLCEKRAISQRAVDNFDNQFELELESGQHGEESEPGDDPRAPYRREHFFATNIERLTADQLAVDWRDYDKAVNSLP